MKIIFELEPEEVLAAIEQLKGNPGLRRMINAALDQAKSELR